jgi:hypothetical protein
MAFDGEGVLVVDLQPLRLLLQRRDRLRRKLRRIGFEENAVADIDHEILLTAGRRAAAGLRIIGPVRASGRGKRQRQNAGELCRADDAHNDIRHSAASMVASLPHMPQV